MLWLSTLICRGRIEITQKKRIFTCFVVHRLEDIEQKTALQTSSLDETNAVEVLTKHKKKKAKRREENQRIDLLETKLDIQSVAKEQMTSSVIAEERMFERKLVNLEKAVAQVLPSLREVLKPKKLRIMKLRNRDIVYKV